MRHKAPLEFGRLSAPVPVLSYGQDLLGRGYVVSGREGEGVLELKMALNPLRLGP